MQTTFYDRKAVIQSFAAFFLITYTLDLDLDLDRTLLIPRMGSSRKFSFQLQNIERSSMLQS